MIARKGVLLSDPSVARMSHMQWLIEARALAKRENDQRAWMEDLVSEVYRASMRGMREMLVHLLGLNVGAGKSEEEDGPTPYLPLVMTMAPGEVVEELLKRETDTKHGKEALDSDGLDELNEDLMNFDFGDLEPLLNRGAGSNDPYERWMSEENKEVLKSMDVDLVTGLPDWLNSDAG